MSSIYVDPANGNHAWISYSGFNSATPGTPGHVFEVTYNPAAGTSTWADRSFDLADLPITDLVRDDVVGDAALDAGHRDHLVERQALDHGFAPLERRDPREPFDGAVDRVLGEPRARGMAADTVERDARGDVSDAACLDREVGRLQQDGKIVVEFPINVWPGWAPIIVANAGLEPSDQSIFAKKHGFYVKLSIVDDPVKARDLFASGQSHVLWGTLDMIALFAPELVKDTRTVPVV